ncbi:MAG: superoxide dismutase [Burkholderiales bacterium]|nr:superoxide dismutase [Burkholderiales bacterium]
MTYPIAPLFCRPWTLNGLSPRLIESHYAHNYGSAVRRLNAVSDELAALDLTSTAPQALGRLKREQASLLNSTLLHELYFASLGGDGRVPPPAISAALARDFGSFDRWRREFMALAESLAGESGWIVLSYLPRERQLMNLCATEHAQGMAGGVPILALDMYEHAYQLEFGANQEAYVAAFMRNILWPAVESRYAGALDAAPPLTLEQPEFAGLPGVAPEEVLAMLAAGDKVQLIDTRPRHYTTRDNEIMAGAVWRDPERISEWMGSLSKDQPVVTFCVYGFHIGCQSASALRDAGYDARYMRGGHFAWKALDGPVDLFKPPAA